MPILFSASLTASSLKGFMTASIFFIMSSFLNITHRHCRMLKGIFRIRPYAVFVIVDTVQLPFPGYAKQAHSLHCIHQRQAAAECGRGNDDIPDGLGRKDYRPAAVKETG